MNIKDFKVGQTVWIELTGNASRGKTSEQCIEEWEITSVGKKYIKAARNDGGSFYRETVFEWNESYGSFVQKTNYCKDYILHTTKQEIDYKFERSRLWNEIEEYFRNHYRCNLSVEQLKQIHGILFGEKGEQE